MEYKIIERNYWHRPIKEITLGFMLNCMTFNLLGLNYILPAISVVLLYSGFRDLRIENKELNRAWIFSIINIVLHMLNLIYISTPLNIIFENNIIIAFISISFQIIFLIIFRKGIKKVFNNSNVIQKRDPILKIIIFKIIVFICAITNLGEIWIIVIPIIIYYFYIFRLLYKLSYDLETINCKLLEKNKRISNKKFLFIYSTICIFIVGICCIISNHIKLDSSEVIEVKEFGIRNMLIDKGIPIEIVKDIEDKDIIKLRNLINAEVFSENLNFKSILNKDRSKVKVTTIFFELIDNEIYTIEYFNWGEEGSYWQNGFAISNTWPLELVNGKILYEKDGINYFAEIPRLNGGIIKSINVFGDERQDNKITGAINYPYNSKKQRGYIFYKIGIQKGTISGANIVNYINYNHPFRIPYTEIEKENIMFSDNLRQHYTNFTIKLSDE